jgi:glycosyltransferase involved in cell wall biosynthesis
MNICHIITTIERGGAENYVANLCKSQSKKNNVFVIYLKGKPHWKKFFLKNKIISYNANFDYGFFSLIKSIFFIRKIIKKEKIKILHAHLVAAEILAFFSLLFERRKIKFFITKHLDNFWLNQTKKPYYKINDLRSQVSKLIESIIITKSDKVIAISQSVKKYLINGLQINKYKVKMIYYGIKIPNNLKLVKKTDKFKKKIIFGTISRLVEQKNIELAIDAFKILHEKNYNF